MSTCHMGSVYHCFLLPGISMAQLCIIGPVLLRANGDSLLAQRCH